MKLSIFAALVAALIGSTALSSTADAGGRRGFCVSCGGSWHEGGWHPYDRDKLYYRRGEGRNPDGYYPPHQRGYGQRGGYNGYEPAYGGRSGGQTGTSRFREIEAEAWTRRKYFRRHIRIYFD